MLWWIYLFIFMLNYFFCTFFGLLYLIKEKPLSWFIILPRTIVNETESFKFPDFTHQDSQFYAVGIISESSSQEYYAFANSSHSWKWPNWKLPLSSFIIIHQWMLTFLLCYKYSWSPKWLPWHL